MPHDITQAYWDLVLEKGRANGLNEEDQRKLRSAQMLRSLGSRNGFTKASIEVGQNITSLTKFIIQNQQQYSQLGRLPESERDQIEEEVGSFVRACGSNIEKLQNMIHKIPSSSPAKKHVPPSADLLAHRQGLVLILSERLGTITSDFDRLRSLRYKQLQKQEANRKRRTPQALSHSHRRTTDSPVMKGTNTLNLNASFDAVASSNAPQQQAQQQVDAENLALQQELLSMMDQSQHAERTVREIAILNQMFSTAILHQSEQIEKLYSQAVAATGSIQAANIQLDKAVKTNKSSQKLMFFLLLTASLCLLFVDWWYS